MDTETIKYFQKNQDLANRINEKTGTLFCIMDEPIQFGMDFCSFSTTEKWRGVKMVPEGVHFIHYNSIEKSKPYSEFNINSKIGAFIVFNSNEVLVRKWDPVLEELKEVEDEDERERWGLGVKNHDFDSQLVPYPYQDLEKWKRISSYLTPKVIRKLQPEGTGVRVELGKESCGDVLAKKDELQPLKFSLIPKVEKKGKGGRELTQAYMDRSEVLERLILEGFGGDEKFILSEIQFCFVYFLFGCNYLAFEQWKSLLELVCNCEEAIMKRTKLFIEFFTVLEDQLDMVPEDFFLGELSKENFLVKILGNSFEIILGSQEENPKSGSNLSKDIDSLKSQCSELKRKFEKKFSISFDLEEGDDAPVIVDY